jgi:DNA-binding LytR/AlgR family response regulator
MANHSILKLVKTRNHQEDESSYSEEYSSLEHDLQKLDVKIDALESLLHYQYHKIMVSDGQIMRILPISSIVRCASDSNYCHIFLSNGKRILIAKTLKSIEEKISHNFFHRIHQSHLVNQHYVQCLDRRRKRKIYMSDGSIVPISKNFKINPLIENSI